MTERVKFEDFGFVAAGLAAGMLTVGTARAEAQPAASAHPGILSKNGNVLVAGENIHNARILSPSLTKDTSFRLRPKSLADSEDLAVVYDKRESDILIGAFGEPELGDSVGFVIESSVGKTIMKLVFFKTKTGRISLVSPGEPLDPSHELFGYVDPKHPTESYDAVVSPQTNTKADVTVSFKHRHSPKIPTA